MTVSPAEIFEVEIAALGAQGDGIVTHEGATLFVPYTVPGDRVLIRRAGADRALPVELVSGGAQRRTPPCPHFGPGKCGGCALQHLDDALYAEWKTGTLTHALARAGIEGYELGRLARTPPGARRRAEFLVRVARNRQVTLGFHVRASRDAVDIGPCPVLTPALEKLIPKLRLFFADWPSGSAFDALATETDTGIDLVLTRAPAPDVDLRQLIATFTAANGIARVALRSAPHSTAEILAQHAPVRLQFGSIEADLPPGAFLQASHAGETAIIAAVTSAIGGAKRIADLYCGVGTIALALASKERRIYAAERSGDAIKALDASARRAGFGSHVHAELRHLERRPLSGDELRRFDAIIFDPPREGAAEQARALAESKVPVVVGVSCNPTTFARDAQLLAAGGYRLRRVTPVDQFLWSPHLELVGVFSR